MVECVDGSYYTGSTPDIEQRLGKHNAGRGAKYTAARKPVRLVYFEKHPDRSLAAQREAAIKKLRREEKEKLIATAVTPSSPAVH